VGIFVAAHQNIRHLWHVHEIIEKPYPLFRFLSYLFNKKQNQTIVVSEAVKNHWKKYVPAENIKVLYNGVDYWLFDNKESTFRAELGIDKDAIVMGMMGRVHFWKGQDYFLKIAGVLHKTFPNLVFVIVGDAFSGYEYLYDNLNDIIQAEQLQAVVKQVKYRSDIVNVYHSFDLFVLPSLLPDPAPAVVTEAMACGLPVAITKQGGAMEMIEENISGILLPLNNPSEAAAKIAPLIQDATARKEMGLQARARIEKHFSRELFNKQIIALIEQTQ
jgi:glycosyltransferase involved in cell wall biosynthesis